MTDFISFNFYLIGKSESTTTCAVHMSFTACNFNTYCVYTVVLLYVYSTLYTACSSDSTVYIQYTEVYNVLYCILYFTVPVKEYVVPTVYADVFVFLRGRFSLYDAWLCV